MIPRSLSIRGITAFSDTTVLDLTTLPLGLICVVGPNGAGKTTIMECLAPGALYREFPSRPDRRGLLAYATRRDAHVDLTFDYAGQTIRCLHQLDPHYSAGRGKGEANLYVDGESVNDGKVVTFDEAVAKILPSRAVFLASAYAAQNRAGNFTTMKQAARRELFAELLGLGEIQSLSLRAREHRKTTDAAAGEIERRAGRLQEDAARHEQLKVLHREAAARVETISTQSEDLRSAASTVRDALAEKKRVHEAAAETYRTWGLRRRATATRKGRYETELSQANHDIDNLRTGLDEDHVELVETNDARRRDLEGAKAEKGAEWREVNASLQTRTERRRTLQERIDVLGDPQGALELMPEPGEVVTDEQLAAAQATETEARKARDASIVPKDVRYPDVIRADLERAQADAKLIDEVPCEGRSDIQDVTDWGQQETNDIDCSACPLLESAVAGKAQAADWWADLNESEKLHSRFNETEAALREAMTTLGEMNRARVNAANHERAARDLERARQDLAELRGEFDKLNTKVVELQTKLQEITGEGDAIAVEIEGLGDTEAQLLAITKAKARLPELEARRDGLARNLDEAAAELEQLDEQAPDEPAGIVWAHYPLTRQKEAADEALTAHEQQLREVTSERDRLAGKLEALGDVAANLAEISEVRSRVGLRRRGFALLERALGREGIQALEIDAAGPEVSELATSLLRQSLGSRFAVELRTVQEAEGNKKQREVFDLRIHDGNAGDTRSFDDLSGGEQTLVDEAVKLAIAVFNARRHGQIRTLWRDEADGRLDPKRRAAYPAMLRAALDLGGFDRLFYVSHDPAVQAQADALIVVEGGKARIEA